MVKRLLWWIPALGFGVTIYWFSSQSQPPGSDLGPDYLLHFFGYGFFGVSVLLGITEGFQIKPTLGRVLSAFLIVLLYGCFDEYHQSFVPGRHASLSDILADSLGALVFLTLAVLIVRLPFWRQAA
jgi:VanZ family protein